MPPSLIFEATTGAVSAVIASAIVYPLDVVSSKVQVNSTESGAKKESILRLLKLQIARQGVPSLYSGINISLVQTFISNFGYFFIHTLFKKLYLKFRGNATVGVDLALGALAGAISRTITMPISVVTTRFCE